MSPDRYRQIKTILQAALEIDPARQAAFLESACLDDPELKAEVQSLLDHDVSSAGFLEQPAVEGVEAASHLQPGSRIGPYEIVEHIGAGGMGEVYRARDPRFEREVAIKLLPAAFAQDQDRLSRFEREARAAGSLNHPNILTIHDFGYQTGVPYLVSELLRGETLRQFLERSDITPRAAVAYAAEIARGLGAAHARDIVHRDLKPENIFSSRWRRENPGLRPGEIAGLSPGEERLCADAFHRAGHGPRIIWIHVAGASPGQTRGPPCRHL